MTSFLEEEVFELYEWYSNLENRIRVILEIIPFGGRKDLKKISTPRLVPILVEAASIIDSIFRRLFPDRVLRPNKKYITKKGANIFDFFRELEADLKLTKTSSLAMISPPLLLIPFEEWSDSAPNKLKWWRAYNRLKHDRIKWGEEANLLYTLNALCGLHQLMMKIPDILKYSLRFKWVHRGGYSPEALIDDISKPNSSDFLSYTNYFCTPLKPTLWDSVDQIRPARYHNAETLANFLGRYV